MTTLSPRSIMRVLIGSGMAMAEPVLPITFKFKLGLYRILQLP